MRILIVKLSSIGDVVHTLPAAALLRRSLPDARIAWVVERRASAILKDSPVIDELIELDTRAWRKALLGRSTIRDVRAGLGQLRAANGQNGSRCTDVAIDLQGLIKSGLVAFASRARKRIGFETSELREKASKLFLTEQVETAAIEHVIEKNLAVARAAIENSAIRSIAGGREPDNGYEFPIAVSSEDERYVEHVIENRRSPFAIINPGGGWATKLWPSERYAEN